MPHVVTLRPSGKSFEVRGEEPILDAAQRAGLMLPYSCRSGACSTCKARVLRGEVEFGDALTFALSQKEREQGYALLCCARPRTDVEIEATELAGGAIIPPKQYPCRVARIERLGDDVAVLTLRMPPNENIVYYPGQYIDLLLGDGVRRSYSLAKAPDLSGMTHVELHVRHHHGGLFTDRVFTDLKERDLLRLEGPFGTFFLREDTDKPCILLATGTGFAPIKAIVEHAAAKAIARPMTLYWGGRCKTDLYMVSLIEEWVARYPFLSFVPVLSRPTGACSWSGRVGYVQDAVAEDFPDLSGHQVYACGSPTMVASARDMFTGEHQLPAEEFFADAFLTSADLLTSEEA